MAGGCTAAQCQCRCCSTISFPPPLRLKPRANANERLPLIKFFVSSPVSARLGSELVPNRRESRFLFFFLSCAAFLCVAGAGSRGAGIVDRICFGISGHFAFFFLLAQKRQEGSFPARSFSWCFDPAMFAISQVHMASSLLAKPSGVPPIAGGSRRQRTRLGRRWVPATARVQPHPLHQLH